MNGSQARRLEVQIWHALIAWGVGEVSQLKSQSKTQKPPEKSVGVVWCGIFISSRICLPKRLLTDEEVADSLEGGV
jgi:hypothetical protein